MNNSGFRAAGLLCLVISACAPRPETRQLPLPPPMPAVTVAPPANPESGSPAPVKPAAPPARLDYRDHTFRTSIQAVRLYPLGQVLEPPLIPLTGTAKLELLFDDLQTSVKPYRYQIIHCNRNWEPSELETYQYLEGFDRTDINEYNFSTLSRKRYIQYRATVPGNDQRITRSGQYLLVVYDDDQPENPVLTRRFYVAENLVGINAEIVRPAGTQERNTHQQIRFRLEARNLQVSNPYEQLGVHVLQNGRWDNALRDVQPQFVRNTEFVYERPDQLFEAGKEWRFFSLRSLRYVSERVDAIIDRDTKPLARLFPDEVRVYQPYQFRADMNGSWFVAVDDTERDEVEADYVAVNFFLPFPAPVNDGEMYLFGQMTEYRFDPEYKLEYDLDRKGYTGSLYLKQGVYNYQYAFVEDGGEKADLGVVEGHWFETENRYEILVYYRDFDGNYDRLVGYSSLLSAD